MPCCFDNTKIMKQILSNCWDQQQTWKQHDYQHQDIVHIPEKGMLFQRSLVSEKYTILLPIHQSNSVIIFLSGLFSPQKLHRCFAEMLMLLFVYNVYIMSFDSQDVVLMEFLESSHGRSMDFFKQVLDNAHFHPISDHQLDFAINQKKSQKAFFESENGPLRAKDTKLEEINDQTSRKVVSIQNPQIKIQQTSRIGVSFPHQFQDQIKNEQRFLNRKQEKLKKSTRCDTNAQDFGTVVQHLDRPAEMVVDFSSYNNLQLVQNLSYAKKKANKISKKYDKQIMKEKTFGKTLKLSFPKKLVEMFLNHCDSFQIQDEDVREYNRILKGELKKSKKNDYTFEKQVSQILGETEPKLEQELSTRISKINRRVFNQIINATMKQEVIMRDKIAKNRQLYMVQLKVFALRCRSKRLSKKGTYK